jgi:hypothetical protein
MRRVALLAWKIQEETKEGSLARRSGGQLGAGVTRCLRSFWRFEVAGFAKHGGRVDALGGG